MPRSPADRSAPHFRHSHLCRNACRSLVRGDDRVNLELNYVTPTRHPFVKKRAVSRFHQLKATREIFVDPARDVPYDVWSEPTALAKAPVDGSGIPIPEMFDDHV